MDAAPTVKIAGSAIFGKAGAVRMSRHQHLGMFCGPCRKALLDSVLFRVVLCGAGRILEGKKLQRTPDIADKKAAESPQSIIEQIALMPVYEEDALPADPVF